MEKIVLRSRAMPEVSSDGRVVVTIHRKQIKPKYPNQQQYYILLEDHHKLPEGITVVKHESNYEINPKSGIVKGTLCLISAIGQVIHDWVKEIGLIWVSVNPEAQWVQAKAA